MARIKPIVIVGAARSGTKMLRDCLSQAADLPTVPYDINFVWRRGNQSLNHDEFTPEQSHPRTRSAVLRTLTKFADESGNVIEKTVSNALRPLFVERLFPEARFLFLYRSGLDVVESVLRQWGKNPPVSYMLDKVIRTGGIASVPYLFGYASSVARNAIGLGPSRSYVWGVRYRGIDEDLKTSDLASVCSYQWIKCVEHMLTAEESLGSRVVRVRYEDFVSNPTLQLGRILNNLSLVGSPEIAAGIRANRIGTFETSTLSDPTRCKIKDICAPGIKRLGY